MKKLLDGSLDVAGLLIVLTLLCGSGPAMADATGNARVFATVGNHQFTQQQVDDAVLSGVSPAQLYDLRKHALDKLVDDYLIGQAANKAGLTPDQYVARGTGQSQVTEAEAHKFYDDHKAAIDQQTKGQSFDQVKGRIVLALEHQQEREGRDALIARLRAETPVKEMLKAPRAEVASAGHPWSGSASAPVTVVEFSDFQCPYCRAAENPVKQLKAKYGDKIKFVYVDFPLGFHEHAMDAARAAQCAAGQDKFWQYHDALFADQSKLAPADLKATATKLGLDSKKFNACFDHQKPDDAIHNEQAQGQSLGVTGTPTFFINGRQLVGAQPIDKFSEIVDQELAAAKAPQMRQASKTD